MTDTPEMVEIVARAICASQGLDWDAQANAMTSGAGDDDEQEGYREMARAAIEAMREPTGSMVDAGARSVEIVGFGRFSLQGQPSKAWRTMVDAALGKR